MKSSLVALISTSLLLTSAIIGYNQLSSVTEPEATLRDVSDFVATSVKYVAYVDQLHSWWGDQSVPASIGVPGTGGSEAPYNVINLAFYVKNGTADAATVWANPFSIMDQNNNPWGKTKDAVQKAWAKRYHDKGMKIMISAFGATERPTSDGTDANSYCGKIAQFVKDNNLDGVDLDYEDNDAIEGSSKKAEPWLIACTKKIREILPVGQYILTHAPQAPYFKKDMFPGGGYLKVHQEVGNLIDWYNIQFYNQGDNRYDTYQELFVSASGYFGGTAVAQIAANGVPISKLVVGKPTTQKDADNTGWLEAENFGQMAARAKSEHGWQAGIMNWEYSSDSGDFVKKFQGKYKSSLEQTEQSQNNLRIQQLQTVSVPDRNGLKLVTYVDRLNSWWGSQSVPAGIAVPGTGAPDTLYNVINLAFYLNQGPVDAATVWANPFGFMEQGNNPWGTTIDAVQKAWIQRYRTKGIKVLISAFGATEFPTSAGNDPNVECGKIAQFAKDNNLDGVDLDWEDNDAIERTTNGEPWLIACTRKIREILPVGQYLLTHAPQAPYFKKGALPGGGYLRIDQEVGNLIDWYNIQYYNQGDTRYDSYEELFTAATGPWGQTSVAEIARNGVPINKLVVGKPINTSDASNTGWVDSNNLGKWAGRARSEHQWEAGIMNWQYASDQGQFVQNFVNGRNQALAEQQEQ